MDILPQPSVLTSSPEDVRAINEKIEEQLLQAFGQAAANSSEQQPPMEAKKANALIACALHLLEVLSKAGRTASVDKVLRAVVKVVLRLQEDLRVARQVSNQSASFDEESERSPNTLDFLCCSLPESCQLCLHQ